MSERQSKRLRSLEARTAQLEDRGEDLGARMTACEAALNWGQSWALGQKDTALEEMERGLRRARNRSRTLTESVSMWKALAVSAMTALALTVLLAILL